MDETHILEIRWVTSSKNSGVVDEVMVLFKDVESRDAVASYAKNLAPPHTRDRKRTKVPNHLQKVYNLLKSHENKLRQRYSENLKRTIKFDEYIGSFYLSVK